MYIQEQKMIKNKLKQYFFQIFIYLFGFGFSNFVYEFNILVKIEYF